MAEIKIQEKKRPIWPWIVGILVLAAALWLLISYMNRNEDPDDEMGEYLPNDTVTTDYAEVQENTAGSPDDVQEFIEFVDNDTTSEDVHEYVRTGSKLLAGALSVVVNQADTIEPGTVQLNDSLMMQAQRIETDTSAANLNAKIKDALNTASQLVSSLQTRYPDLNDETRQLKSAANNFRTNQPLENQEANIKEFFEKSKETLLAITMNKK